MKPLIPALLLVFCTSFNAFSQSDPPELSSWIRNTTGLTGYNNLPANVQQVRYSAGNVYINASGIPSYSIGPWPGNPNTPTNQNFLVKFSRTPTQQTSSKTATPLGPIGLFTNGVAIFNSLDANSYNNGGIWHQNAVVVEASGFDACHGHTAPGGFYHHHQNPLCLYTADPANHSPIVGYAFDGFPIYGPYSFQNTAGTGPITRMRSSYRKRAITQRTSLSDGTVLTAGQYGPAVAGQYVLGYYAEDFEYVNGLGDLDAYNGRFCKTPEYPEGTYAYFVTIDSSGNSEYPYMVGPSYYGIVASTNIHATILESVATYSPSALGVPTLLSPDNRVINQPLTETLQWSSVASATKYQVQVALDSNFALIVLNDSTITDTTRAVNSENSHTTYYWHVRAGNGSGFGSYSSARSFSSKLATPSVLAVIGSPASYKVRWSHADGALHYYLEVASDSLFSIMNYADSALTDTTAVVTNLQYQHVYHLRVRALEAGGQGDWSAVYSIATGDSGATIYSFAYQNNWNIVSLPLTVNDPARSNVFPAATSSAYAYGGTYTVSDSIQHGKGYWLHFGNAQSVAITGMPLLIDTIDVVDGWNLVGSVAQPVAAENVSSIPPGITTSHFFGFGGGYSHADSLQPGHGYWINVSGSGKLILDATTLTSANPALHIHISDMSGMPPDPPRLDGVALNTPEHQDFHLNQNYPNPFNPSTRIEYEIASAGKITLGVYDLLGREVARLFDGVSTTGKFTATWNADNMPSGVYLCRMTTATGTVVRTMIFAK